MAMGSAMVHSDGVVFEGRIYPIDSLMWHTVFFIVAYIFKLHKSHTC